MNKREFLKSAVLAGAGVAILKTSVGKTVKEAAQIFPELHFVPIAIQRFGTQFTIY